MANDTALGQVTENLRARGIKGTLVSVSGRLFWRCTATSLDGIRKNRRVPLNLPNHKGQLVQAESRIVTLAAELGLKGVLPDPLPWAVLAPSAAAGRPNGGRRQILTVEQAVLRLEERFWEGKVRSSAAERTWTRVKDELRQLPQQAALSMDLLVSVARKRNEGSRSRLEACKVFKRLAKEVGMEELERLDAIRTPYEPAPRDLLTEEEITALLQSLDPEHRFSWMTWALATYGCRPSETFSLRVSPDGTARVITVKRKGKPPVWRTAMELPLAAEPCVRQVPWEVTKPGDYDSLEAKRQTDHWAKWLKSRAPGLKLYDLRHSWAIRSIRTNVVTAIAASCMGHSIAVHCKTYHHAMQQADVAASVAARQSQKP